MTRLEPGTVNLPAQVPLTLSAGNRLSLHAIASGRRSNARTSFMIRLRRNGTNLLPPILAGSRRKHHPDTQREPTRAVASPPRRRTATRLTTRLSCNRLHPRTPMVSIKDVARAARVSVATVSRVQNESANVTEPTRRRVRAVAERLGYSPHAAARSLSTSKTGGLGVLLPDLYGEFYSELIRGIDQTAQRHGYHLLLASSHNEKAEIAKAVQSMRGRVDGVIMMSP